MVDIAPANGGSVAGNVLFYSKPEPLSNETHAKLGLLRIDRPYGFASVSHVAPLTVAEFPAAAIVFPIIFAGEKFQPLAVMGVNQTENMFIRPDGTFEPGTYIPAYIRRYPFVLAADETRERLVVCIDRGAPMIGELPDLALFDSAGQPTDYTKNSIQFCNDFEVEVRRTEWFVNILRELDLFETRTATFTPSNPDGTPAGPPQIVAEYFAVSEVKFRALPDTKIRELIDNGVVSQIYTHLASLMGWDRLIAIAVARNQVLQTAANRN
jgi:hypothetical protein